MPDPARRQRSSHVTLRRPRRRLLRSQEGPMESPTRVHQQRGFQRGGYATFRTPSSGNCRACTSAVRDADPDRPDDARRRRRPHRRHLRGAPRRRRDDVLRRQARPGVVFGSAIAALVVGLVVSLEDGAAAADPRLRPPRRGLRRRHRLLVRRAFGGQIVPQAVLGTLVAFATMLACTARASSGTRRASRRSSIAGVSYLVFGVVKLVVAVAGGPSVYTWAASRCSSAASASCWPRCTSCSTSTSSSRASATGSRSSTRGWPRSGSS